MRTFSKVSGTISAIAMLGTASPAFAHPHVFVTARTVVLVSEQRVTGLQHVWTFDEMYASDAVSGLDTNKDGKFDKAELQSLAQTNMDGLKEYNYFTTASVAGKPVEFKEPVDYWLEFADGLLTLHFTLPLPQPIPQKGDVMTFAVEDPTYYIAFQYAQDVPVRFSASILSGCKAIPAVEPVTDDQQRLSDAFEAQYGSASDDGSNSIVIRCPP